MTTKPTRLQDQACDRLAEALLLITEAARLDGKGSFDARDLTEIASKLVKASSAFDLDRILARALEQRGRALGSRSGTAELIMLLEGEIMPLETLLWNDHAFRALIEKLEAELGQV